MIVTTPAPLALGEALFFAERLAAAGHARRRVRDEPRAPRARATPPARGDHGGDRSLTASTRSSRPGAARGARCGRGAQAEARRTASCSALRSRARDRWRRHGAGADRRAGADRATFTSLEYASAGSPTLLCPWPERLRALSVNDLERDAAEAERLPDLVVTKRCVAVGLMRSGALRHRHEQRRRDLGLRDVVDARRAAAVRRRRLALEHLREEAIERAPSGRAC